MNRKKVSASLSFALLIVVCLAVFPVSSLQNKASISSHGTINYLEPETPTPTPTPTPSPTPSPTPYVGTNMAPLNTWKGSSSWAPSYWDTSVTHSGNPSWRNVGADPYKTREMNSKWIAVKPGDRIVLSAWLWVSDSDIGTTPSLFPQSGGRLGVDFYDASGGIRDTNGWISGVAYNPDGDLPVFPNPTSGIVANFVGWGTKNWAYRVIDFIVPSTVYGKIPTGIVCWFAAMTNRMYGDYRWQNEDAPVWLSDTCLYVNPT